MADRARVAVLISGRGSNMAALLYAAKHPDCLFEIALVASNEPEAAGLKLAEAEGIATFAASHRRIDRVEFEAMLGEQIKASEARFIALAGYMRLLSPEFVSSWEGRILNIHPSLLPKYQGLGSHARALAAGDAVSGCTVHIVTDALDDGPILGLTEVAILPGDSPETLAARVLIAEHQLYARCLADFVSREASPEWIAERLGKLALALPETSARNSHGALGWRVGSESTGKFFAYLSIHHHGEEAIALLVKTSGQDEMAALIEAEPELYYRPAYYGASGWIAIRLDTGRTDWDHINEWLTRSWAAVAPARLARLHRIADEF